MAKRRANLEPTVLDQDVLVAVLSRHFPGASPDTLREAASDVLLLELLAHDIGVVWEDAMSETSEPQAPVTAFDHAHHRGS